MRQQLMLLQKAWSTPHEASPIRTRIEEAKDLHKIKVTCCCVDIRSKCIINLDLLFVNFSLLIETVKAEFPLSCAKKKEKMELSRI
jgi:hypothetical protein